MSNLEAAVNEFKLHYPPAANQANCNSWLSIDQITQHIRELLGDKPDSDKLYEYLKAAGYKTDVIGSEIRWMIADTNS
jgi:hypothetical protein